MRSMRISPPQVSQFQREIWGYRHKHRRDFPWRHIRDPYRILVSEFMLQQTQVSRVVEKYGPFLGTFPDFKTLARASQRDVLHAWQGLGYNRRAVNLKRLAEIVMRDYAGKLPRDFESLKTLPGVGQSTAGAIVAFAFNKPAAFIETNIRRTYIHFFFPKRKNIRDEEILRIIQTFSPRFPKRSSWREWYWALFDYGAMLGARERAQNPNRRSAHYRKQSKYKGSHRELRGEIIRALLETSPLSITKLKERCVASAVRLHSTLYELVKERIVLLRGKFVLLA